jgi:hypothetical protein
MSRVDGPRLTSPYPSWQRSRGVRSDAHLRLPPAAPRYDVDAAGLWATPAATAILTMFPVIRHWYAGVYHAICIM